MWYIYIYVFLCICITQLNDSTWKVYIHILNFLIYGKTNGLKDYAEGERGS